MSYRARVTETYLDRIGGLIRDARKHRGLTQTQLAEVLGTSQSAVHRIEAGNQNLSLDMVNRIAEALDSPLISVGRHRPAAPAGRGRHQAQRRHRGPLLQERRRRPALRQPAEPRPYGLPRHRQDRGGQPDPRGADQHRRAGHLVGRRQRPRADPAGRSSTWTRWISRRPGGPASVIMFLGPLLHSYASFELPYAGGCDLGARTIEPHLQVLRRFGSRRGPDRRLLPLHGRPSRSSRARRSPSPSAATR